METSRPPRAGKREWIGLAVIALPCLLYSMDLTVLNLALPALSADLRPGSIQLLWIVDIYGFMVAGSLITMGTLGDRIGRRKLLMIGAAAFGCASVLAACSTTADMLVATRALLGIAGATLAPSTLSLIRNMFHDPVQRTFAISVWATSYSVGAAIGPLLGGILLQYFWWGSVFLLGVPVMLLLLVLAPILLPEFRDTNAGRIDLASAATSLVAVLAIIYGLKHIAQDGLGWVSLLSIAIGVGIGAVFLHRQRVLANPFLDLSLFRQSAFNTALATNTLSVFVAFGSFFFTSQYLQLVLGLSPFEAGLWTMPSSGGFVVGSMITPVLARRFRPVYLMCTALVFAAIGFGLLTQVAGGGLAVLVAGTVMLAFGLSPSVVLSTDMVVSLAPPERSGSAASLSETSAEFGGALGIAVLGSLSTIVYRSGMAKAALEGIPANVKLQAQETLGGSVAAAEQLPEHLKPELLQAAQHAFTYAFEINASIGVVFSLAIAAMVFIRLRHVRLNAE